MAEEELVDQLVDDLGKGIEDESSAAKKTDDLSPEEKEEVVKEHRELKKSFDGLTEDLKTFKRLVFNPKEGLQVLAVFITKNVAIGAIFYFVSFGLSALIKAIKGTSETEKKKKKKYENKQAVLKAVKKLIDAETCLSKAIHRWLDPIKDKMIELKDMEVPLSSIFVKPFTDMEKALKDSYVAASNLLEKKDGKVSWKMPTKMDFITVIATSDATFKSFKNLKSFGTKNVATVSDLSSLDKILSDAVFAELKDNLADVRNKLKNI